jgi:hypothetical protein
VLTVDPVLQAYRTDSLSGVELSCPKPNGDLYCEQVAYAPWATLGPPQPGEAGALASSSDDDGGSNGLLLVVIALAAVVVVLLIVLFLRRRRDDEALEV